MLVPDCFVGAAETAAPPKDFCENLCNLWEAFICQKVLWVLRVPWEDCNVGACTARLVHFLLWQAAKPSGDSCPSDGQSLGGK